MIDGEEAAKAVTEAQELQKEREKAKPLATRRYNPELLDKDRLVAISKCDMLDEELIEEMREDMKEDFKSVPYMFISSVSQLGIQELKDKLWELLND